MDRLSAICGQSFLKSFQKSETIYSTETDIQIEVRKEGRG